ncbi:MAG: hypothetical protein ACRD0Q_07785 [Acidimicrobiales bacterium]
MPRSVTRQRRRRHRPCLVTQFGEVRLDLALLGRPYRRQPFERSFLQGASRGPNADPGRQTDRPQAQDQEYGQQEKLLAGRWVVTTSLSPQEASAAEVVVACRRLLEVESSFRVRKDLIELRPVFHWTEDRVRAHVAICVLAGVIEALMEADLRAAGVADPDIDDQVISPRRALRELGRIRRVTLTVAGRSIERDTATAPCRTGSSPPSAWSRQAGHPLPLADPRAAQIKGM